MSGRKVLITFPNPPGEAFTGSKDSLARKLKNSSHIYNSGVFFSGAENNGGNSLGALFPILHLVADLPIIKELTEQPRRLARSLVVGGSKLGINQAVFVEKDQDDIRGGENHHHETNSIILIGCKVLEVGSRTGKGVEASWRSWTNIGVLVNYLIKADIEIQNLTFLKQILPSDPRIFMYCILINIRIIGLEQETKVLSGL